MSRGGKIALGIPLAAVVAIAIVITVAFGFHGLVIYAYFASFALGIAFLGGRGGGWIEDWSRERFKNR